METLLAKYAKYFAYGVLVISILLMGFIIYEISQAKKQFANQLITKSVAQTETELDNFFESVEYLIKAVEEQHELGFWEDLSRRKTILHNISIIENYAPISSIGIADSRGYEFNVLPDTVEGRWLTRRVFVERWGFTAKWNRWAMENDSLKLIESWEDSLETDTRKRPWFKGAMREKGDVFWTTPYEYTTGPEIGITASTTLSHPNDSGDQSKIIAFDLTLSDLNTFVDDLELTKNQNVFLLTSDNDEVIALNEFRPELNISELRSTLLSTPEKLQNQSLLEVLKIDNNRNAFDFSNNGNTWWGILRPYHITEDRTVNIVSVLPEDDFALEISRTLWVSVGSFFLILFLSVLIVRNHNRLHLIGNTLADKNKLISEQKKFLFSEVHHRVKNNLALISAFLELEKLNSDHPLTHNYLQRSMRRIKIIAIVQEEAYNADELGIVPAAELVSSIIGYLKQNSEVSIEMEQTEDINININQALTYGLLLNELLFEIREKEQKAGAISIIITQNDGQLSTNITFPSDQALNDQLENIINQDIIAAFIKQLNGSIENRINERISIDITFTKQQDSKGIVGSKFYQS